MMKILDISGIIEVVDLEKILTKGKSDVLEKFVSRYGKPFKARLVLADSKSGKKVGFEFPD